MPGVVLMNVELEHSLVHLRALGKANGSPLQPFQVCAEVRVLPFDLMRPAFPDPMLRPRDELLIALPLIRAEAQDPTALQLTSDRPMACRKITKI